MRNLVTERTVKKVLPVKKADFLEVVVVDGWEVVVKKGEFTEGQSVLYFEIDSLVPEGFEELSFLKYNKQGFHRLKTIKLRGQISQGLVIPATYNISRYNTITKYNNKCDTNCSTKQVESVTHEKFPDFIPKTDQERIQNIPSIWDHYKEDKFEVTRKLNGSSMTAYIATYSSNKLIDWFYKRVLKKPHLRVCSRSIQTEKHSVFYKTAIKYKLDKVLKHYPFLAIQGELVGPKIQGNYERLDEVDFYVFDIYDMDAGKYLPSVARTSWCKVNGIRHVPVIEEKDKSLKRYKSIPELLDAAKGETNGVISEGLVFKNQDNNMSFKVINNDFLLAE